MGTTEKLAIFFVDTTYEDIPEEVVRLTKRYFIDWLAAAIGGYGDPGGKIITKFAEGMGGSPEARLIGSGIKTSTQNAALVNGTLGHIIDFDDSGFSHPSACILPVILALGEKLKSSGKEILLAQNMGYECFGRLYNGAKAYELVLRRRGIHPTSLWGSLAAAVAASKLLKLNVKETSMAMGLSATQAAGLMENFGTMTKGFHCGNAPRAGVTAAILVKMGFDASQTILEGSHGFYNALIGEGNYDLNKITADLGEDWLVISHGIDTKRHPSCAATLRAIEATLDLRREHHLTPDQIASIEVTLNSTRKNFLRFDNPGRGDEAKFSMQYAVAVSLVDGDVTLESYEDAKVCSDLMKELMGKVKLTLWDDSVSDDLKKTTPVKITLKNGHEYTKDIINFTGSAKNPMSDDDFYKKFLYCASRPQPGLLKSQIDECIRIVNNLEKCNDITNLMDVLMIG